MCNENRFDQMKGEISSLVVNGTFGDACSIVQMGLDNPEVAEFAFEKLVEAGAHSAARTLNDAYAVDLATDKAPEGMFPPKVV
ncbi:MAG: hypothetical protein ACPG05_05195 [Bdellovibrionales bacterium]